MVTYQNHFLKAPCPTQDYILIHGLVTDRKRSHSPLGAFTTPDDRFSSSVILYDSDILYCDSYRNSIVTGKSFSIPSLFGRILQRIIYFYISNKYQFICFHFQFSTISFTMINTAGCSCCRSGIYFLMILSLNN